jgi:hypothetical protein
MILDIPNDDELHSTWVNNKMWDEPVIYASEFLSDTMNKGLLLPALSYSRWMPLEMKAIYRKNEIFASLEKIPDNSIFNFTNLNVPSNLSQSTITPLNNPLLGEATYTLLRQNLINHRKSRKKSTRINIPVHTFYSNNWYLLVLLVSVSLFTPHPETYSAIHLSIISPERTETKNLTTLQELVAFEIPSKNKLHKYLENNYPINLQNTLVITFNKKLIQKLLQQINPLLKPSQTTSEPPVRA